MMRSHTPDDAAATRWLVFVLFFVMFVGRRAAVLGGRVVANCTGLKRAIERQQQRVHRLGSSHDMRFELREDTVYNCESTIHIPRSESVVIVGAADGTSQISFRPHRKRPPHLLKDGPLHLPLPEEAPYAMRETSLFLNEGTLRLENVIFVPNCLGEGCDRTGTGSREEACGVRLVQNSGELFVSSSVLGTGDHSSYYYCFCGTNVQGRLVYSEGTESSVVIQGSTLMDPSPCGGSAVAVVNGYVTVIDSTLTGSHDQAGSLLPIAERDYLRISATIRGTVCESETPEFCGLMREMVEVVHIDNANCWECSGVHRTASGSAVQANSRVPRPGRGLSGSSGIVIDQGLLLIILTIGLIMLVVLLCLGDIWIRNHPRHPVSMFFTLPAIPSPTGNMPWKEDGTAFLTAPTLGRSNPFSNYAMSDDEISYVVPPDVHETLEQSASRMQSISTDGQKVEGFSPGALNIKDQEIRHEDLEAALRGYGTTEWAQQGGSKGVTSPGVMAKEVEIESYVKNQSRENLDSMEIYFESTQIPDLADVSDDESDEAMADVADRQLGAVVDRPFGSVVVEGGLKSSNTAAVAGSSDRRRVVDPADASASFEGAVGVTPVDDYGARTALDTGTALSKTESLGAEHLEHKLDTAYSATVDTDAESAVVSVDTGSNDNTRYLQPNEKDIEPTVEAESSRELVQENRIDIEKELEGPVMESMRESTEEELAAAAVDESAVRENEADSVKKDMDEEGEIESVGEQNIANIFDQENTARLSTAELGIPGSNYSDDSPEQPQVVSTERVRPEAFRKLELTRSMSSTAIEISPVSSLWKLKPSHCSDSAVGAPSDSSRLTGETKAGDKMGPSCSPSKYIIDDPMACSSPERRESGGLDAHELSPAGDVRIKPTTPLSSALGINRRLGIGDNPYTREIAEGAAITTSAYEPPLSASNLSYSPPSTEGEDECISSTANRTRPFFDKGIMDPAHLRLREEHSETHSLDRDSEDSDDSPFAYLSLTGPFPFDLADAGGNGDGGMGGVSEFPASVSSSDDSDVLGREDEGAAAQVSSHEECTSIPEGGAVESKKQSEGEGSASSTEQKQFFPIFSRPKDMGLERVVPNTCLESTPPEQLVESAGYLLASNEALVATETAERPDDILTDMPSTPAETSGTPSFFSSPSSPMHAPSPSPARRQQTQHAGCESDRNSPCQPLSPGAGTSLSPERVGRSISLDLTRGGSSRSQPEKSFEASAQESRRW